MKQRGYLTSLPSSSPQVSGIREKNHILLQGLQGSESMWLEGDNSVSVRLEMKVDGSEGTVQRRYYR